MMQRKTEKLKKKGGKLKKTATPPMVKLATMLFPDDAERELFIEAILEGQSREKAILVLEERPEIRTFPRVSATPWQPEFVIRLQETFKPAQHPLYARGSYYSLDFSSVFAASAMMAIPTPPKTILDLCSSPGGKGIFAWRMFQPEALICNETMRNRTESLINNLHRCKIERSQVWVADPRVYAKKFPATFDFIIVDAPCSGQSMIAKGDKAVGAFTNSMVDMNHSRQRRITGNAIHALKPGGHLLYMTCTYSYKENEKILEWMLDEYPFMEAVPVPHLAAYQSEYTQFPCYRLFPQQGMGAGAFTCLLRRTDAAMTEPVDLNEMPPFWAYGDALPFTPKAPAPEEEAEKEKPPKSRPNPRPAKPKFKPRTGPPKPGGRRGRSRSQSKRPGR